MYIYKITNRLNGKSYIGQTIQNPVKRWKQHCSSGKYGIGRALKKHGKENFTFQVIFTASDRDNLDKMEKIFIKMYNTMSPNGYNLCEGGISPRATEETRHKRSKNNKNCKPIKCIETGEVFSSGRVCARVMNLDQSAITKVLKGKQKAHGGFTFEYVGDNHA